MNVTPAFLNRVLMLRSRGIKMLIITKGGFPNRGISGKAINSRDIMML